MFDMRSVNIVPKGYSIIVEDPVLRREEAEVDDLSRGPNEPFCSVQIFALVDDLSPYRRKARTLEDANGEEEYCDIKGREDELVEEHLLEDDARGSSGEFGIEEVIPVVGEYSHSDP